MKTLFEKRPTLVCLSAVTMVGLITGHTEVFGLWFLYGIYKFGVWLTS